MKLVAEPTQKGLGGLIVFARLVLGWATHAS
jgi:hypothetical protein